MSRKKRNNLSMSFEEFTNRPCYATDIAELLGEDARTTKRIIDELGEATREREWGSKYSPKQVKYILNRLGYSEFDYLKRSDPRSHSGNPKFQYAR